MTDQVVTTPASDAPAPKARKKTAGKAKAKKAAAAKPSANGLSSQRVQVLKVLAKKGGSLEDLTSRSKLPERAVYHHLWHMRKDGLARSFSDKDVREVLFEATAKGKKTAAKS